MDERLLADFAYLDPVYVDDAVDAVNLGTNFSLLLYRWQRIRNNDNPDDYERTPGINLILPRTSILARSRIIASWLHMSTPPTEIATRAR